MLQENNPYGEAGRFFGSLHHSLAAEERIEVRHKLPGGGGSMRRKFFAATAEAARYATSLVDEEVYAGVAPRRREDGTKAGIARLWALWADLDLKHGHTRESRTEQLEDLPCRPSMLVWSGGGWHPYWLLEEAAEGPEELDRAELSMRYLAEGLGGDPVHDYSRILRMPGTFNHKYGEPRRAKLERCDSGMRYGLDELERMAEGLPREIDGDDQGHAGKVRRDILAGPIREDGRNVAPTSVAGSLRDRGLDAETMRAVLLEVNRRRCEPPLPEPEVAEIGRSVARYPAGRPRYRRSPARRLYPGKGR